LSSARRISHPADYASALAAVALGATALTTQIVILRECLSVFYGNELVIGFILSLWMAITGLGALAGRVIEHREDKYIPLSVIFIGLGLTPPLSVFFLRYLRNLLFEPGIMLDLWTIFAFSSLFLLPFCFLAGFTFPLLSRLAGSGQGKSPIARIYSWEAFGSVLGGGIFSLVLVFSFSTFEILLALTIVNSLVALILAKMERRPYLMAISFLLSVIAFGAFKTVDLDMMTRKFLFPHQRLLFFKDTPYGNVTVTSRDGQTNFYENGLLLFSSQDPISREEAVHYAMAQHPHPRYVLLISGGFAGLIGEILKYRDVAAIDYVELNPALTAIGKLYTPELKDRRVNIINTDARLFIRETRKSYDVVLVNLPDPQTAQINRFYTDEFFHELKSTLNRKTIVSLSLTSSADYLSKEARALKGSILATLKKNFSNVVIIAGSRDFFLASDSPLAMKIAPFIEQKGISNTYVNAYYIDDDLTVRRSEFIRQSLLKEGRLNKDFAPIAYLHSLLLWLSAFEPGLWIWPLLLVLFLIFAIFFRTLNPITFGIFTGGFSASSLEVILLFSFQIIYGYVYQMLGIIVTTFMAGLGLGALYKPRSGKPVSRFIAIQYGMALLSLLLPLFLATGEFVPRTHIGTHAFFVSMAFLIALLIGAEFSVAANLSVGPLVHRASRLYSIDLIGAAMGALLISALCIPIMGVLWVSVLIAFLNIISATVAFWKRKEYTSILTEKYG